jgi:hypothetical protein
MSDNHYKWPENVPRSTRLLSIFLIIAILALAPIGLAEEFAVGGSGYYSSASGGYYTTGAYLPSYYSSPYYSYNYPYYTNFRYYSYPLNGYYYDAYYSSANSYFNNYYYPIYYPSYYRSGIYVSYSASGSGYYGRIVYSSAEQADPPADPEPVQTPQETAPQQPNARAAWMRR